MTAPAFTIFDLELQETTLIVTPKGDASSFRYNQIHNEANALLEYVQSCEANQLLIDFGRFQIAGSIMMGAIIRLARQFSDRNGQACFCNASEPMREVMQSMNLTKVWPYFETRAVALEILTQGLA